MEPVFTAGRTYHEHRCRCCSVEIEVDGECGPGCVELCDGCEDCMRFDECVKLELAEDFLKATRKAGEQIKEIARYVEDHKDEW